jgi:hypothetical protein
LSEDQPSIPLRTTGVTHLREQRDDYYRAIGRYIVEFSALVALMRNLVAFKIVGDDEKPDELIRLAFGSMQAQQIADAFFAVCRESAVPALETDELAIEKCLRQNHVNAEIRWRNVMAHADWLVPVWTRIWTEEHADEPTAPPPQALFMRVQLHKPEPLEPKEVSVAEIDGYAERVSQLTIFLWEFGMICTRTMDHDPARGLPQTRIRDAFELTGSANARSVRFRSDHGDSLRKRGLPT